MVCFTLAFTQSIEKDSPKYWQLVNLTTRNQRPKVQLYANAQYPIVK